MSFEIVPHKKPYFQKQCLHKNMTNWVWYSQISQIFSCPNQSQVYLNCLVGHILCVFLILKQQPMHILYIYQEQCLHKNFAKYMYNKMYISQCVLTIGYAGTSQPAQKHLIHVCFSLNVHKYIQIQILMSKKCLWSDGEMTFVVRYLLDVEFRF